MLNHPLLTPRASKVSYRGGFWSSATGATLSTSIDIGGAAADRRIIVAAACVAGGTDISSIVVNGVSLTADALATLTRPAGIFSGLVTSGNGLQTVTVTFAAGTFLHRAFWVYTGNGIAKKQSRITFPGSLAVDPNDFILGATVDVAAAFEFISPTNQLPRQRLAVSSNTGSLVLSAYEWQANGVNPAFNFVLGGTSPNAAVASYG